VDEREEDEYYEDEYPQYQYPAGGRPNIPTYGGYY
jgi:hypothetical protein